MTPEQRNDNKFLEDVSIMFAMYCDEAGLTAQEGEDLAGRVGDELFNTADDRRFQEV